MMKKTTRYLAALLAALMLLGLCACSAQQTPAETTEPPAATNEAASTTETEEISTEPETTDTETVTRAIDALRDVYHVDAEVVAVQKQSIVLVDEKDTTHS